MADFDAQQPVRTTATEFTTEVANASGTTINPAEDYAQGSTTSGQNGILIQGAVTTAAPTYTTGQTDPLSLTTAGALRIDGSGSTQPVSGTVTANQGTPNTVTNKWPIEIVDSGGVNVATVDAAGDLQVDVNNFPATVAVTQSTSPWVDNITQIGGGALSLGQKTSANSIPVVIASDQSAIPVTVTFGTGAILTYFTDAAVASGSTVTHSIAGPINLDHIHASGSGEIKMNIATGTTGSETDKWVGFTSASYQNCEFDLEEGLVISTGQSVKVTLKNRDNQAQDLYLTFETH